MDLVNPYGKNIIPFQSVFNPNEQIQYNNDKTVKLKSINQIKKHLRFQYPYMVEYLQICLDNRNLKQLAHCEWTKIKIYLEFICILTKFNAKLYLVNDHQAPKNFSDQYCPIVNSIRFLNKCQVGYLSVSADKCQLKNIFFVIKVVFEAKCLNPNGNSIVVYYCDCLVDQSLAMVMQLLSLFGPLKSKADGLRFMTLELLNWQMKLFLNLNHLDNYDDNRDLLNFIFSKKLGKIWFESYGLIKRRFIELKSLNIA